MDYEICNTCDGRKPLHAKNAGGAWEWVCIECDTQSLFAEDLSFVPAEQLDEHEWCQQILLASDGSQMLS